MKIERVTTGISYRLELTEPEAVLVRAVLGQGIAWHGSRAGRVAETLFKELGEAGVPEANLGMEGHLPNVTREIEGL